MGSHDLVVTCGNTKVTNKQTREPHSVQEAQSTQPWKARELFMEFCPSGWRIPFHIRKQLTHFMIQLLTPWRLNTQLTIWGDIRIKTILCKLIRTKPLHDLGTKEKQKQESWVSLQSQKQVHEALQWHNSPRVMMLLTEVTGSFSDQLLAQESVVLNSCDQDKIAST